MSGLTKEDLLAIEHPEYPEGEMVMIGDEVELRDSHTPGRYVVVGIRAPHWYEIGMDHDWWVSLRSVGNPHHERGSRVDELRKLDN